MQEEQDTIQNKKKTKQDPPDESYQTILDFFEDTLLLTSHEQELWSFYF